MKVIVTGGAGMIGSNLCSKLLLEGHQVIAIDNLWRGKIDNLKYTCRENFEKLEFYNADLSHFGDWVEVFANADCVFHLADIVGGIHYVFDNQASVFRKNLHINTNVANATKIMNAKRYVYVGTACSFPLELQSSVNAAPLVESSLFPANPESAYGWSKLMGQLDAQYLADETKIPTVCLMLHNVYGAPCDINKKTSQVIPSLICRAIISSKNNEILTVWGSGEQGRAFIHVNDVVTALMSAMISGENQGPIQIGPNVCTTIKEISNIICKHIDPTIKIAFDISKPTGDQGRSANFTKAKSIFNWKPTVDLHDGIKELSEWIINQEK